MTAFGIFMIGGIQRASAADATSLPWVESPANPIYDPVNAAEKAYFPSVLKISANDYRMWYQSNSTPGNTTVAYATSPDGAAWTLVTNAVSGLIPNNSGHPHVEFAAGKFRIWYWNSVSPYGNAAMHYAESVDGISWTNDSAITGNLITSASGQWNSGSYGAADVVINDAPTNIGANPFDYRYAMYYDATSGGYEQIALGYSANGIDWTLYGTGPVLPKGPTGAWDSGYATAATVIKGGIWRMWYSGGVSASHEGIGCATSPDGLVWTKCAANPVMSTSNGVAWRNNRTYTPSVINDGGVYKMWFTGRDTATGNYAIGYATITPPATLHVIKFVVNGNGNAAIPSDFNVHVKSESGDVAGSPAPGSAAPGTSYSLSPGTYTISEDANAGYSSVLDGECALSGTITLSPGDDKTCTVTNTDIPSPPPLVSGPPVAVSVPGSGVYYAPRFIPLIGMLKVPTPLTLPQGTGSVIYDYTVWNVGGYQPLTDVSIADDRCGPVTLVSGDLNNNGKLDPGEYWKFRCDATLSNTTTGTAVVTGYSDDAYHDAAVAGEVTTVVVGGSLPPPLINIVTVPSRLTPFPFGGGDVTYTYTVTNPGLVAMHDVIIVDDKCGTVSGSTGGTSAINLLNVGETKVYTCTTNVPLSSRSIATAEGKANGFTALGYAFSNVLVSVPLSAPVSVPAPAPVSVIPTSTAESPEITSGPSIADQISSLQSQIGALQTKIAAQTNQTPPVISGPVSVAASITSVSAPIIAPITQTEAGAVFQRPLFFGAQGTDVTALQTLLEQKGFLTVPVGVPKGFFGGLTRAAVTKYQENTGLPTVGIFGPLTTEKLISDLKK